MSDVLALIPARAGSKGIQNKNSRLIDGRSSPTQLAVTCAASLHCPIVVSSDQLLEFREGFLQPFRRPPTLATDTTPMIDVVKHALGEIPGPPDQIVLLVQPTQPLRNPAHLKAAIELLESSGADSVVSVTAIPQTHHAAFQATITEDGLLLQHWSSHSITRRQGVTVPYIRDGTVYAFYRRTVTDYEDIYGFDIRPLIIPPEETCPLDTPEDWLEAERRLRALSEVPREISRS